MCTAPSFSTLHDDIQVSSHLNLAVAHLLPKSTPLTPEFPTLNPTTNVLPAGTASTAHAILTPNSCYTYDLDSFVRHNRHIYVPSHSNLQLRILQYKHDHLISGHFGITNTTKAVLIEYYWPSIHAFVKSYCISCIICKHSKAPWHKPYGFLKPLPALPCPWDSIFMDFIEQLPLSGGFTTILIIVDHLSKQGIFIPTVNTIDSKELALLFIMHVYSKHGVLNHTTSDHGTEFVSRFLCALGEALNMHLHFMSGYHPQGDGQTEQTNQTLEQYLCMYCNYHQSNWSTLLPLAEFTYNNTLSTTTGMTPLFANKVTTPT